MTGFRATVNQTADFAFKRILQRCGAADLSACSSVETHLASIMGDKKVNAKSLNVGSIGASAQYGWIALLAWM